MSAGGARGGWSWASNPDLQTKSVMLDVRQQLTLQEALVEGVGKAHRGVTYAHFDFRNTVRGSRGTSGKVK